jgi:hypothetical protein
MRFETPALTIQSPPTSVTAIIVVRFASIASIVARGRRSAIGARPEPAADFPRRRLPSLAVRGGRHLP